MITLPITMRVNGRRIAAATGVESVLAPPFVTVPNVPMVSTGIDYPTSTGLITLTERHLRDLVASQDDPAIHSPRTKIGHSDPRFNKTTTPDGDVLDGEPSLGTWINLRLGDNDQTVYGDLVGVPAWFASIMSTAYPSRSIEGNFDVETVTGHKWALAVDAVAMLGVVGPGITTLDDLPILFSAEGPSGVTVTEPDEGDPMSVIRGSTSVEAAVSDTPWSNFKDSDYTDEQYAAACVYDRSKCSDTWTSKPAKQRYSLPIKEPSGTLNRNGVHAAASRIGSVKNGCDAALSAAKASLRSAYSTLGEDPPDSIKASAGVVAQVNLDDVRRGYYDSLEPSQMWWWIRAVYFDPNELIVDDDEGGLYRVPFQSKGEEVSFGDPVQVKIQYVDTPAKTKAAALVRASVAASLGNPVMMFNARADSRPGGCMTPEEAAAVRARHGLTPEQLPDDADDATVVRVVIQAASARPETPPAEPAPAPPAPDEGGNGGNGDEGDEGGDEESRTRTGIQSTAAASRIPGSSPIQLPEGTIVVDKATWEAVADQARQGAELAARTRDTERDSFLNTAIKAGKFPPSRKNHYLKAWDADPEGTRGLIDSLAAGLVPVEARGTAGTGQVESAQATDASAYEQSWLTPAERQRVKVAQGQTTGDVQIPAVVQGGD